MSHKNWADMDGSLLVAFVVVNGVPSVGVQVMIGNGKIGKQPASDVANLPSSAISSSAGSHPDGSGNNVSQGGHKTYAGGLRDSVSSFAALLVTALASATVFSLL